MIHRGEKVVVVMTRNNIFPWQTAPCFDAFYAGGPNGPGDTHRFYVRVGDVIEIAINGNSLDFIGFYPRPDEETSQ